MDAQNTPAAVSTPKCICTNCKRESHDGYHEPFFECLSRMWREGDRFDRFSTVFFLPALGFLQLHELFFRNNSYCCGAPLAGDPGPRRMVRDETLFKELAIGATGGAAALGIDPPAYACGGYDEDDDQPRDFGDL